MPIVKPAPISPSGATRTVSAPPRLLHHIWTAPYSSSVTGDPDTGAITISYLDEHPLWAVAGVHPVARCRVDALDKPPGAPDYDFTPQGVASNIVAWVQYCSNRCAAVGRSYEFYGIFLQNHGTEASSYTSDRTNAFGLCLNWRDAIKVDASVRDLNRCNVFYCEQGITQNAAWTSEFVQELSNLLEAEGLPGPYELCWDWENLNRSFWSLPEFPNGYGSWSLMLADERYSTELIDGEHTLQWYWENAKTSNGSPMTLNTAQSVWQSANIEFRVWFSAMAEIVAEYALDEGVFFAFRQAWPTIDRGNYEIFPKNANFPIAPGKANEPAAGSMDFPMDRMDIGTMTCYPFPNSAFQDSGSSFADWLSRYDITPTGDNHADLTALWLKATKQNILNTYNANPLKPLELWMGFEGMGPSEKTYSNIGGITWTLTWELIDEIARYAIQFANVRRFHWWQNPRYLFSVDGYVDLLNGLNAYALELDAGSNPGVEPVVVVPPPSEGCSASERLLVQNYLLSAARNFRFCEIQYDDQNNPVATGRAIAPSTAMCNEISSRHEIDPRMRRRESLRKTSWMFQLHLAFDSEVLLDSFEEIFSTVTPRLSRKPIGGYTSIAVRLRSSNYEHPTTKQSPNGSRVVLTFEADVGRT